MKGYINVEMIDMVRSAEHLEMDLKLDISTVKLSPVGIYQTIELSMPLLSVSDKMEDFFQLPRTGVIKEPNTKWETLSIVPENVCSLGEFK
ncbi:hypothetical protein Zmor_001866 [Zophobas morio]|uniref:Uncharacterized protein n=1 Tax=Zophobas morio TaxID=2755281 RepID=A0AA38J4Z7_9CUCU|nr:hypothetical protein Zmor_001866 [Zophobas morio]